MKTLTVVLKRHPSLVPITVVLILLIVGRDDAVQLWNLWLAGDLPEDFAPWGHSATWWGRFGKLLQCLGGFTAILDFINIDELRERAEQNRLRLDRLERAEHDSELLASVEGWQRWVYLQIITPVPHVDASPQRDGLITSGRIGDPPDEAPFTAADVDHLRTRFLAARAQHCGCLRKRDHDFACDRQLHFLDGLIGKLAEQPLSSGQQEQLRRIRSAQQRRTTSIATSLYTCAAYLGSVIILRYLTVPLMLSLAVGGSVALGVFATVKSSESFEYHLAIRSRRLFAVTSKLFLAEILHRTRSGHRLRELGFTLVLIGFAFDLFCS